MTNARTERVLTVGAFVGRAIADTMISEGCLDEPWGDDPLNGDDGAQFRSAGIEPDTDEWTIAETAAKAAYYEAIRGAREKA